MKEDREIYILNTSALLTYIEDENGSDYVENLNLMAGKLKATNTISLADAYISAVCQEYAGILVHKDPHFEKMSPLIKGYKLPYKTV